MATNRTKEERLKSLNSRLARLMEIKREATHRRDVATANFRNAKEAELLAERQQAPKNYNPSALRTTRQVMQAAMDECDHLDRKISELRQRIDDVATGNA